MTIHYFIRHFISENNISRKLGGDSPLAHPYATMQTHEVFHLFSNLFIDGIEIDTIYTSPLLRAKQTAQLLANDLEKKYSSTIEIEIDEALREQNFGVKEGSVYKDQDSNVGKLYDNKFEGAEKPAHVRKRLEPFVRRINAKKETSLVVGHNLNLRTLSSMLASESSDDHYVLKWKNGDVYVYNSEKGTVEPRYIAHVFENEEMRELRRSESKKKASQRILDKRRESKKKSN